MGIDSRGMIQARQSNHFTEVTTDFIKKDLVNSSILFSDSITAEDGDRDIIQKFVGALTGKTYDVETASRIESRVYDILLISEGYGSMDTEELSKRVRKLKELGDENALNTFVAGLLMTKMMLDDPSRVAEDKKELQEAQIFYSNHIQSLLDAKPELLNLLADSHLQVTEKHIDPTRVKKLTEVKKSEGSHLSLSAQKQRLLSLFFVTLFVGGAVVSAAEHILTAPKAASLPPQKKPSQSSQNTTATAPLEQPLQTSQNATAPSPPAQPPPSDDLCQGPDPSFCHGNLGIPRIQMPQLDGQVGQDFTQYWKDRNVAVVNETIAANKLTPTQGELLASKVMTFVKNFKDNLFNPCSLPVFVSQENNVLDGHHRWAACKILKEDMKVVRIDVTILDLLTAANGFQGVQKQDLKGKLIATQSRF